MSGYLDRMVVEHRELFERIDKLRRFLAGAESGKLADIEISMLQIQLSAMKSYRDVLAVRISSAQRRLGNQ